MKFMLMLFFHLLQCRNHTYFNNIYANHRDGQVKYDQSKISNYGQTESHTWVNPCHVSYCSTFNSSRRNIKLCHILHPIKNILVKTSYAQQSNNTLNVRCLCNKLWPQAIVKIYLKQLKAPCPELQTHNKLQVGFSNL